MDASSYSAIVVIQGKGPPMLQQFLQAWMAQPNDIQQFVITPTHVIILESRDRLDYVTCIRSSLKMKMEKI